jgi:hypothetical protein
MPLSEHEQRILEEIERRLAEEDPRLVKSVSQTSVASHSMRRIRWGVGGFVLGFVLLLFFVLNIWFAVGGFAVMLASTLLVYHYLKRIGRDQLRSYAKQGGHLSVTAALARWAERIRRQRGSG